MTNYILEMYRNLFVSLKRGNYRGVVSNAKPIFLISLVDVAPFIKNEISVENKSLKNTYYNDNRKFFKDAAVTPMTAPYFHLNSESFYHLVWKDGVMPPSNSHTPSAKFLRENLLYAKLDDELWDLLQDRGNREYLKQSIVRRYLED